MKALSYRLIFEDGVMKKNATIYDVAHHASVSISTVSRVLNAPSLVNPSTRKAVLLAIEELQFRPKADAKARAQKHLRRIGVLTPFMTEASFIQRIRGISTTLSPGNFELIIYTVKSAEQLEEYLDMLPVSERIDGLIVLSLKIPGHQQGRLRNSGIPVVFVEHAPDGFNAVLVDNRQAGYLAASYLLHRGFHSIGFVGEFSDQPYTVDSTEDRLQGFREALSATRTSEVEDWIRLYHFGDPQLIEWLDSMFDTRTHPRAMMCSSDLLAAKVIQQARKHGIDVPGEIAVLGFDDLDLAEYLDLSTVRQDLDYSGRLAAEIIQDLVIKKDSDSIRKIYVNISIVERGSC